MTKILPLVIAAMILTAAGPLAVEWVGGLTMDLATQTTTQMQGALK